MSPPSAWHAATPAAANVSRNGKGTRARLSQQKTDNPKAADPSTVFIQILDRPARKLILRRGVSATEYFTYCNEVGCDVWDRLSSVTAAMREPMGLWLPESLRTPGTSEYV
jgi:AraC family transcriptional regulator